MKKPIGVTGSHGFIGKHLIEQLDNYIALKRTGHIPEELDGVIDLAAYGNMADHKQDPREIYYANFNRIIDMTYNSHHFKWLIYISTSSVSLSHQTYYSASKHAAEEYLKVWSRENDFPVAIIRPFSVTGPGEQKDHLIPKLIHSAMTGEEMPFVSDPVHDFIDVRDVVSAILTVKKNIKDMRGEVFEVGNGESVSNLTVKNFVELIIDRDINTKEVDLMRKYDTKDWKAENESLRKLGWKPKYDLYTSLRNSAKEYERTNT